MDAVIVAAMQIWCSPSIRGTDPFVLAMPCLSKGKSCWFYIGPLVASVAKCSRRRYVDDPWQPLHFLPSVAHRCSFAPSVRQYIQQFQSSIDQRSHIAPK
jgi:hypothetical protein